MRRWQQGLRVGTRDRLLRDGSFRFGKVPLCPPGLHRPLCASACPCVHSSRETWPKLSLRCSQDLSTGHPSSILIASAMRPAQRVPGRAGEDKGTWNKLLIKPQPRTPHSWGQKGIVTPITEPCWDLPSSAVARCDPCCPPGRR